MILHIQTSIPTQSLDHNFSYSFPQRGGKRKEMDLHPIGRAQKISSNITKAIASIDEHLQNEEKRSQLSATDYDGMRVFSFKDKTVDPLGTALKTALESHGYIVSPK